VFFNRKINKQTTNTRGGSGMKLSKEQILEARADLEKVNFSLPASFQNFLNKYGIGKSSGEQMSRFVFALFGEDYDAYKNPYQAAEASLCIR